MTATATPGMPRELSGSLAQTIVNDIKKPILVLDQDLRITFANDYFCAWIGLRWEKISGQSLEYFLNDPIIPGIIREAQLGSAMVDYHATCTIPGLGLRELLLHIHPLRSAYPLAIFVGLIDITNSNMSKAAITLKMEAAQRGEILLRNQTHLSRSIMESSGDGIGVLDAEGYCVLWNPACEQMLGMGPGHIRCELWSETFGLYLPDKVTLFPAADLPWTRALNGESCDETEVFVRNDVRKEGLWVSITARPLTGGQHGAVAAFRDITFAKNATEVLAALAEEVARSNRELEQFAYVAAHDLQEPLRMVSSYVQLLSRRYKGKLDAEADEFIGFATAGAKRMSALINGLLGLSRIGRGEIPDELVDCEKIMELVVLSLGPRIATAGTKITHGPLPKIRASELQITQILQNLIDNAIKFQKPDNPSVHISARDDGKQWVFSVADNGIGIEPEYKDRIFVIFQRLNSREDYDGNGIGLAICKKIIEQRRGKIWVESNQPAGTTVFFTWLHENVEQGRKLNA
jgi:signal transduction histidine kinase